MSTPALPPHRRRTLDLRVARYGPDLVAGLEAVFPPEVAAATTQRLLDVASAAYAERDDDLHELDERRLLQPDWFQQPGLTGYAAYAERFAADLGGNLAAVGERVDHLEALGVGYLHLMPLLTPRPGDSDGGYAVADYRTVRADLGTTDDLRELTRRLRGRGISLVLDLVLNHVAREHEWAERARAGEERYRRYFHVFADRELPDAYEETVPEVFPDFAPGSFTHDPDLDAWVWTTFNTWQWDLDWSNPDVLVEFAEIVCHLANLGVEVLRLDAIAFLWKRLGTTCQNQPEVHPLTQALRAVARIACPGVLFKAEAIVSPRDLMPYLGTGAHAGKVSDLAYHNTLMVQVWSMLASGETALARQVLGGLPPTPPTATWITYARCHDDIGWAIDDRDAPAVGLDGAAHRAFLSDWYAGDHPGSWAAGLVFQHNPATGDKRISGTAAALTGLAAAEASGDAGAVDAALARFFLAHAVVAGWGGIPVIWSGDELAQPNDPDWADEPGHEGDNRWAHRPRLDPARLARRDDLSTVPGRAFAALAHLARVRRTLPQLHAATSPTVVDGVDDGLLVTLRSPAAGVVVGVYNVTDRPRPLPAERLAALGLHAPYDALGGHAVTWGDDGIVLVPAYAAWWLVDGPLR
ncbi:alpha-amylase family protein [Nocardioides alkalitolerans]|uniref:alpha-amylase family protein n=1 Tax=Nocardioides alkalitolerans TaxID=281714 RepID=UPI0003FA1D66|nr:alpha-amylase family protein [Nocardioides alkalitolerans]